MRVRSIDLDKRRRHLHRSLNNVTHDDPDVSTDRNKSFEAKLRTIAAEDQAFIGNPYETMKLKSRHHRVLELVNKYASRRFDDPRSLLTSPNNGLEYINEAIKNHTAEANREMEMPVGSLI